MVRSVVVHVGQPKAASTSLQHALTAEVATLHAAGIAYPLAPGRSNQVSEAADFILGRAALGERAQGRLGATLTARARERGGWRRLVDAVTASERAIVSAEDLADLSPGLAEVALNDLTGGRPDRATVVIVVRPVSGLLPSMYGQATLADPLPRVDVWARLTLLGMLTATASGGEGRWLDAAWLRGSWASAGEVRCVAYESPTFEPDLVAALDLDEVIAAPFLGRSNTSVPAAWSLAWQEHRRTVGWHDDRTTLIREIRAIAADDPVEGGRFALAPQAARLADEAFPLEPGDSAPSLARRQAARDELAQMVRGADPVAVVEGIEPAELAEAVERCRARLQAAAAVGADD
jgi:hypothetical protein